MPCCSQLRTDALYMIYMVITVQYRNRHFCFCRHGLHQVYSCRGIEIVVKYFQERGHEHITVFVPAHRLRTEHRQTKGR